MKTMSGSACGTVLDAACLLVYGPFFVLARVGRDDAVERGSAEGVREGQEGSRQALAAAVVVLLSRLNRF